MTDQSSGYSQVLKATNGTDTVYYSRGFELISRREGDATSYYLYDGGLSVRALTDEAGAITDTLVFDAFGNETEKTGTTANTYGFQDEEHDATGLYYLRARYMDPTSGTFTSMDTYAGSLSDPMSLHNYLFANSNPVMYSDPSGYTSLGEQVLVCALIGEIATSTLYLVELFTTDNIQYSSAKDAVLGALQAAGSGILGGIFFCLLYNVFALVTTAYIATTIFGASGLTMSLMGMLDGSSDIDNGDTALGYTKIIINAIAFMMSIVSLGNSHYNKNNTSWYKQDGSKNFPPNSGAVPGTEDDASLIPGKRLGRYGKPRKTSSYLTEPGANPSELSLPPDTDLTDYYEYEVVKTVPPGTVKSKIAPWGGSKGGGTQYDLPMPIKELEKLKYIRAIKGDR